jgi:hypothetical protein
LSVLGRACGRVARVTSFRLAVFACLSLVASWPLLSTAGALNTFRDAQVIAHYESIARLAVVRFHQAPLWDPYYCGGMYLLGTPQARFVAPNFVLTLLFGEPRGAVLSAFAMLIVGLEGTFRYARARHASSVAALVAAPIFGLAGEFAIAPQNGWFNFFGFALVPWIVLGFRRALRRDARGAVLAAAGIAWCTGLGGTYAVPMVALWCGLELVEALLRSGWARNSAGATSAVVMAIATASLGAGLAAVRLWPVIETLRDAPRVVGGSPGSEIRLLLRMLFLGTEPDGPSGQFFVGALAVPAALFALLRRRSVPLAAYGALWVWLAAGYAVTPSLFAAAHALPVYGALRYPERYLILFGFVVSILAARGITMARAFARASPRHRLLWRVVHAALLVAVALDVGPLTYQHFATAATRDLGAQPPSIDGPFRQARGNRFALAYYAPMQRGSLSCWDAYPVPESPLLQGNLPVEEQLSEPTAGHVTERYWSPDRIDLDISLDRPATVRVNQNWHVGWHSSVGQTRSDRGLLVVDLPAGTHSVVLRFAPISATGGLVVTLASIAAACLLFFAGARPLALGVAAITPPLILLASLAHITQPAPQRPLPPAPTGEAIVVDTLSPRATSLGVRFQGGVTLLGAFVDRPRAGPGETIVLELDWRRETKTDPDLGVFVHIEPPHGDTLNGDHVELSQTLIIDAAPPGKVLRDLLPITLPADAPRKDWKIYAGLWRVRGGGERVRVVETGSARVEKDRVAVATFVVK